MDPITMAAISSGVELTNTIMQNIPWDKLDERHRQKMIDKKVNRMNLDKKVSIILSYALHLSAEVQNADFSISSNKDSRKSYEKFRKEIDSYIGTLSKTNKPNNKLVSITSNIKRYLNDCIKYNSLSPLSIGKIQKGVNGLVLLSSVTNNETLEQMDNLITEYGLDADLSTAKLMTKSTENVNSVIHEMEPTSKPVGASSQSQPQTVQQTPQQQSPQQGSPADKMKTIGALASTVMNSDVTKNLLNSVADGKILNAKGVGDVILNAAGSVSPRLTDTMKSEAIEVIDFD